MIPFGMQPLAWVLTDPGLTTLLVQPTAADVATGSYPRDVTGKTLTYSGGVTLSGAAAVSGGASLLGNPNAPMVTLDATSDFDLGTGDFTLDVAFRRLTDSFSCVLFGRSLVGGPSVELQILNGALRFAQNEVGTILSGGSIALNTDYTCQVRRSGTSFSLWLNGSFVVANARAIDLTINAPVRLFNAASLGWPFDGRIYAVRLRRDASKEASSYTAPWSLY